MGVIRKNPKKRSEIIITINGAVKAKYLLSNFNPEKRATAVTAVKFGIGDINLVIIATTIKLNNILLFLLKTVLYTIQIYIFIFFILKSKHVYLYNKNEKNIIPTHFFICSFFSRNAR